MLQDGWTGVLIAAHYGHADIVRDLVKDFGCDKDAVRQVTMHADWSRASVAVTCMISVVKWNSAKLEKCYVMPDSPLVECHLSPFSII